MCCPDQLHDTNTCTLQTDTHRGRGRAWCSLCRAHVVSVTVVILYVNPDSRGRSSLLMGDGLSAEDRAPGRAFLAVHRNNPVYETHTGLFPLDRDCIPSADRLRRQNMSFLSSLPETRFHRGRAVQAAQPVCTSCTENRTQGSGVRQYRPYRRQNGCTENASGEHRTPPPGADGESTLLTEQRRARVGRALPPTPTGTGEAEE